MRYRLRQLLSALFACFLVFALPLESSAANPEDESLTALALASAKRVRTQSPLPGPKPQPIPTAVAPAAPAPIPFPQTFSFRQPVGHTHTCVSGHSWDHAANAGHVCEFCGESQYTQDAFPRPVLVRSAVAGIAAESFGACVNGSCQSGGFQTYQQPRRGLFGFIRR